MELIESFEITDEEANKVYLRSNEVNEILGQIPNRIIRYGITVIVSILTVVLAFAFVFKYPDLIRGSFFIQSSNPPVFLLSRTTGKIQSLQVSDRDSVAKGQLLATIENSTRFASYQLLKESLGDSILGELHLSDLGELQSPFSNFQKAYDELQSFTIIDYHQKKEKSLARQKKELVQQIKLQQKQVAASRVNTQLSKNMFKRDSLLFEEKTIAALSFEKSKKEFVQQQMSLISTEISLSNSINSLSAIDQQILEIELNYNQEKSRLKRAYDESLNQLKGAVDQWENNYCLKSPIEGRVSFSGVWEVNQNVRSGQHVFTVLPFQQAQILAKVSIPVNRAGKVKVGQEVNLKLADFPYREYGMIVAQLASISEVPDSFYVGTIVLPDSLVTNYRKPLPFKQNMQGEAEIITEDLSLGERLLYPLKEIFNTHLK